MLKNEKSIIKKYLAVSKKHGYSIFVDTNINSYEIFYEGDNLIIFQKKKNSTVITGYYYSKNMRYKNIIEQVKGTLKTVYYYKKNTKITEYNVNKK